MEKKIFLKDVVSKLIKEASKPDWSPLTNHPNEDMTMKEAIKFIEKNDHAHVEKFEFTDPDMKIYHIYFKVFESRFNLVLHKTTFSVGPVIKYKVNQLHDKEWPQAVLKSDDDIKFDDGIDDALEDVLNDLY